MLPLQPRSARVLIAFGILVTMPLGFFWANTNRENTRQYSCSVNQRQVWMALQMYTRDASGKFPRTTFAGPKVAGWKGQFDPNSNGRTHLLPITKYEGQPVGWADALIPYLYSTTLFSCAAERNSTTTPANTHYTDYYLNQNLSGKQFQQLAAPKSTIILADGGDSTDVSDATYAKSSLPTSWINNRESPANRHRNAANYLMGDGTIQWLRPDEVTTLGGRKNAFAVR